MQLPLQISVTQADGISVVRFEGELRIGAVADAKPGLVAVLATGSDIRFDLSALGDCDTAGIQLLLMTRASARAKGTKFTAIGHTVAFRDALDRLGIAHDCFELQTDAHGNGEADLR